MTIGLLNFLMSVGPWLLLAVAVVAGYLIYKVARHRLTTSKTSWEPYTRTITEGAQNLLEIGVRRYNSRGQQELMAIETVSTREVADDSTKLYAAQGKATSTAARLNARSEQYEGF